MVKDLKIYSRLVQISLNLILFFLDTFREFGHFLDTINQYPANPWQEVERINEGGTSRGALDTRH